MKTHTTLSLLVPLLLHLGGVSSAPIIIAPWGQISGTDGTSLGGAPYSVYHSIPYALPPTGERRWAKPELHPGFGVGRVFNGTSQGYGCPQNSESAVKKNQMNEDCLWLNVYVPSSVSAGPKSVMIWIYGGGFTEGSSHLYTPSDLITTKDVIVVVIQYRLNVLGFLSSGDDVIPGNYGLWDQALALKWVKDNIQAFGGDPNSITLFGESAGAASVGYQVLSPANKGINFRAILQSGTPLSPWAFQEDPSEVFLALANRTGCLTPASWADSMYYMVAGGRQRADHERILRSLRGKDVNTLIEAVPSLPGRDSLYDQLSTLLWAPTVDGDFLPRKPIDLMRDAAYLDDVGATSRDVMLGINNQEGGMLSTTMASLEQAMPDLKNEFQLNDKMERYFLTTEVLRRYGQGLRKDSPRLDTLVEVLDFFYTQFHGDGQAMEQVVIDTFTDIYFAAGTVQFIRDLTKASDQLRSRGRPSGGRRYLYLFNHYPASRAGLPYGRGLYHGEDLAYEFNPVEYFGAQYAFDANDQTLASTFKSMLSNFAKTGTPQLTIGQSGTPWPEFSLSEEQYLSLEPVPRVDRDVFGKRVALWLDLLPSLVNSTAGINMGSWALPWNQQQQQMGVYPQGYSYYNNLMGQLPMRFVFKGRISFFKLQ